MLTRIRSLLILAVAMTVLAAGCENPQPDEYHSPLTGKPLDQNAMHRYYEPSIQNAVSYNMSIGDGHFVPHTDKLNGLGTHQLDRIGAVLEQHGGTVRYETRMNDEDMLAARLTNVENYLIDTGIDMTDVTVAVALSGGRGMMSVDAFKARENLEQAKQQEADTGIKKEVSEN